MDFSLLVVELFSELRGLKFELQSKLIIPEK